MLMSSSESGNTYRASTYRASPWPALGATHLQEVLRTAVRGSPRGRPIHRPWELGEAG